MFERISPEKAGISSKAILGFLKALEKYNLNTHAVIFARGDNILCETYYAPFHKDFKHRMYSVSKSFVSIAIGALAEEGFISLDDKFVNYFPEYIDPETCHPEFREMTLRDMLVMETCNAVYHRSWFPLNLDDRTKHYFSHNLDYSPSSFFHYDSDGSYMLGVIVEKVTGLPFLEYMQRKFLTDIGFSKDSYCLLCPGGRSFGDSGVMCTARDLLTFARFVLNGGTWEGKRYMNEEYFREACSRKVANSLYGEYTHSSLGYGYQIWKAPNDGFAFLGMGDQLAICDVEHDFIFIINSDNQGCPNSKFIIYHALYEDIIEKLTDSLPEDEAAYNELLEYENSRILNFAKGEKTSPYEAEFSGKTYILKDNPMGIKKLRIDLCGDYGILSYTNAQGDKQLKFGFGHNEFQKFPQTGYSDMVGGNDCPGNMYNCAVSAEWLEDKKLHLKVQVIDKYFGILDMGFSFKDTRISVLMQKTAENFFNEYNGFASGALEGFENEAKAEKEEVSSRGGKKNPFVETFGI